VPDEPPNGADRYLPREYFRIPNSARVWNYWMGGTDNYAVDRKAGDAWADVYPGIRAVAVQTRQFLIRAVRYLAAEAGIRQFLDVGTGLPTMQNIHEVAQSIAPDSKVVYVDNDPVVLTHARSLLTNTTPEGVTSYLDADLHEPDLVIADARNILNFNRPVAVTLMGLLGHVADLDEARAIVARLMADTTSGSYLVLADGTDSGAAHRKAADQYAETGAVPYRLRTVEQLRGYLDGLELVEPGLVPVTQWRPDPVEVGAIQPIAQYGAVARKP
jgi:hypothetical protein